MKKVTRSIDLKTERVEILERRIHLDDDGFNIPIIFNAMFFILGGTDRTTSVWISYGLVHFAYCMLLVTPF